MSTPISGPQGSIDLGKRLKEIEQVETNIREILQLAQSCVSELSKEKQTSKNKMDESSNQFKQKLNNINSVLSNQMAYLQNVCVGSAHQGSTFASQQNIELAQNAEFTLHTDLAKLCEQHFPPTLPAHQEKMEISMSMSSCPSSTGQLVLQKRPIKHRKRCMKNKKENSTMPKLSRAAVPERPQEEPKLYDPKKSVRPSRDEDEGTNVQRMRLLRAHALCNVQNNSCSVPMCGRYFSNLEVLAFHMSYSHQDVSLDTATTRCLVCGTELESAKGKIAHMVCRHRKLAADHNSQCLDQREPFKLSLPTESNRSIARIQQAPQSERIVYDRSTLSDICDMIDIPKDFDQTQ